MTVETRRTDGRVYATDHSYDALERARTLVYPDDGFEGRETLTYSYGGDGLLTSVTSSLAGALASGALYNALGLPTRYALGSGTTAETRHTYYGPDAAGSPYGALKSIQLQYGQVTPMLVNRELTYDSVGNVASIADASITTTETITYVPDDLDRLASASAPLTENFSYSAIGNLTSKNGSAIEYLDSAHKHAATRDVGSGMVYAYDACGNMTYRGGKTFQYDPLNRLTKVSVNGTESRFTYDGDGARTKRLDPNGTVHYAGPFERNVGKGDGVVRVVKHYYATFGSRRVLIAIRIVAGGNSTLYYVGTDHLGGTIRVATSAFAAVDQMRYRSYGGHRDPGTNLGTDRLYTGQTSDAISGLYWYQSRYYDPLIGRFCQPDSVVPDPGNPQALNRYSYVVNNPLKHVDPTGHAPEPPASMGAAIVFALFIEPAEIWTPIGRHTGDARAFGYGSDRVASRMYAWISVDPAGGHTVAFNRSGYVFNSARTMDGDEVTRREYYEPESDNRASVSRSADGSIQLDYSATLSGPHGPFAASIDGTVVFSPDGNGGFVAHGRRDGFPWAEAYYRNVDGNIQTILQRPALRGDPYDLSALEPIGVWDVPRGIYDFFRTRMGDPPQLDSFGPGSQ